MTKPLVIALPGAYMKGRHMREDAGDPVWVDRYLDDHHCYTAMRRLPDQPMILVGYSIGGSVIGDLSLLGFPIVGAVLYEAPLLYTGKPGGDFPVLWIENDVDRPSYRQCELNDTYWAWANTREDATVLQGGYTDHWQWKKRWPPIKHSWDRRLNVTIGKWIQDIQKLYT